jgi:hypothetical protein
MAEYGEWNRKGATLSDKTAKKEYGVSRDFIVKGIQAGRLEYREGSVWGNPYIKILRRQLEQYIEEELGFDRLTSSKTQTELRKIKQEMADLKKRLKKLQTRRTELEKQIPSAIPLYSNRKLKINGEEKENSCKGSNMDRCKETLSAF